MKFYPAAVILGWMPTAMSESEFSLMFGVVLSSCVS